MGQAYLAWERVSYPVQGNHLTNSAFQHYIQREREGGGGGRGRERGRERIQKYVDFCAH